MGNTAIITWPDYNLSGRDNIECILQTYELPQALHERIGAIASQHCAEWGIDSFSAQYEYVAELVERFMEPRIERFAARLDHPVFEDGKTLHDIIGAEDSSLKRLIRGRNPVRAIHAHEIIGLLVSRLTPAQLDLVESLLSNQPERKLWALSTNRLSANLDSIVASIKNLEQKYGRNGRIIVPARPIRSITRKSTGELDIHFGRRHFRNDPLSFYEQHADVYGGLTRRGLQEFDPGLYQALRLSGQVSSAIPIRVYAPGRPISKDQIDRIIASYQQTGSLIKTSRIVHSCRRTIRRYLDMKGIKRERHGKVGASADGINAGLNPSEVRAEPSEQLVKPS